MNPVSILIFNALARRESINLPEIGSLKVTQYPAQRTSGGRIIPPLNRVEFYRNEVQGGTSILTLIEQSSGKDAEAAQRIYNKWLEETRSADGKIVVEGVGAINNGIFSVHSSIAQALNPAGTEPIRVARKSGGMLFLKLLVAAVVVAAVAIIAMNSEVDWKALFKSKAKTEVVAEQSIKDSLPQDADLQSQSASSSSETITPQTQPSPTTIATTAPTDSPKYYIVIGLYSNDENATRAIKEAQGYDKTLSYSKLPMANGKIAIYTSVWEQESVAAKNCSLDWFPDAWVLKYPK